MKWTKKRPTKPGWYWMDRSRQEPEMGPRIVQVRDYGGMAIGNSQIEGKWMDGVRWSGPISEPPP